MEQRGGAASSESGSSKGLKQPTLKFDLGLRNRCIREPPLVQDTVVYSDVLIFNGHRETLRFFERRALSATAGGADYSITCCFSFHFV